MKKNKQLASKRRATRRLELMSHYYDVDTVDKVVRLDMRYEKASDLLETNKGLPECPRFSQAAIDEIADAYEDIPTDYSAELDIEAKDFEGYDAKTLLSRFNDALEINNYRAQKDRLKNRIQALVLILTGLVFLLVMGFGSVNGWFGPEGEESVAIITEILDITAWVFIWEAVTLLFLNPSESGLLGVKILSKTKMVRFYSADKDDPVAEEDGTQIVKKWEGESNLSRFAKVSLLISSGALIAIGIATFFSTCVHIATADPRPEHWAAYLIVTGVSMALQVLGGIAGLSYYAGKKKFHHFAYFYVWLDLVTVILMIVGWASGDNANFSVPAIASLVFDILYAFGVFYQFYRERLGRA